MREKGKGKWGEEEKMEKVEDTGEEGEKEGSMGEILKNVMVLES